MSKPAIRQLKDDETSEAFEDDPTLEEEDPTFAEIESDVDEANQHGDLTPGQLIGAEQ